MARYPGLVSRLRLPLIAGPRRALNLALVSALARAPAFLIPILIAAVFGAGKDTDAYFIAYSAVLFLAGTLAQGVEQAVVPCAASEIRRPRGNPREYLDRAARATTGIAALIWTVGLPLVTLASPVHVRSDVLRYGLCLSPLAVGWCAAAVFAGALVSQWRIATSTGSMLFRGAGALLGLALVPVGGGLWSVALGLGVGECVRLWWLRSRLRHHLPAVAEGTSSALGAFGRAAAAQCSASAATGATPVVERVLALSLGVGAASYLEYGVRLLVIPGVLFEGALAPLLFAGWTQQIVQGAPPSRREVIRTVSRGVALAVGCAAAVALFAPTIVQVLLRHGRFSEADSVAVALLLRLLSVAFIATMGALLLERLYLASARNRTLAILSFARAAMRLGIVVLLLPSRGLAAFALGYAIADWSYLLVLFRLVRTVAPDALPALPRS